MIGSVIAQWGSFETDLDITLHRADERRVERIRFIGVWDTVAAYA